MRLPDAMIALSLVAAPFVGPDAYRRPSDERVAPAAHGEIVPEMAKDLWYILQARNGQSFEPFKAVIIPTAEPI
jgi:hypothetical protein